MPTCSVWATTGCCDHCGVFSGDAEGPSSFTLQLYRRSNPRRKGVSQLNVDTDQNDADMTKRGLMDPLRVNQLGHSQPSLDVKCFKRPLVVGSNKLAYLCQYVFLGPGWKEDGCHCPGVLGQSLPVSSPLCDEGCDSLPSAK